MVNILTKGTDFSECVSDDSADEQKRPNKEPKETCSSVDERKQAPDSAREAGEGQALSAHRCVRCVCVFLLSLLLFIIILESKKESRNETVSTRNTVCLSYTPYTDLFYIIQRLHPFILYLNSLLLATLYTFSLATH